MAMKSGKNKEVGVRPGLGHTEETFGADPGSVSIGGGTMDMFGHRHQDSGIWPGAAISPNTKTGYPQGWDGKSQSTSNKRN